MSNFMLKPDEDESGNDARRVTISFDAFLANPAAVSMQALKKEVEIVVDEHTRIYIVRKLPVLDNE